MIGDYSKEERIVTESKKTKRELTASVISIVLCVAMLVGLTFAWFTDSVTNKGNIIKSGNLDVAFEWANGTEALDSATWQDASGDAIFNYDKWEPGYTEARHIRISNKGNLALKYEVKIEPNGEVSKLAEVIDVYYIEGGQQLANRTDLTDAKKIGTLKELLDNPYVAKGHILAGGNADVATIALKMQESADNEYQNLSIGSDFSVKLVATQYTSENDSFGNDYDKDAKYSVNVQSGEELKSEFDAITDNTNISIDGNIAYNEALDIRNAKNVVLDFNNKAATVNNGNICIRVIGSNDKQASAIFSNGKIKAGQGTYCTVGASNAMLTLNNMILENITAYGCSVKAFENSVINLNDVTSSSNLGGSMAAAGGTINVNGGTYVQTGKYDHNSCFGAVSHGTGTLNVRNMTATGENYGFYIFSSGGTINIYTGNFKANTVLKADLDLGTYPSAKGAINIYGGSFDGKIDVSDKVELNIEAGTFKNTGLTLEQFKSYVADGHSVSEADGVFTVK